ncbi:MAG: Poly-beta-1,6-N-acetyl-D-glucosamine synthase [candidate division WS6 bacterium OLB20]|uniref:Poly-beta-1,6-N-acetyl-D-glucosamine synthase n=1 Tax=candidate division WS6 bacterium OLB20 TaxID=1617426 RepID=A0A136M0M4_9BACT|nr:MAG: Poly-beta-1,6-N-acetyl-D-glucosamine synthase [candidate division WS6 bacterium OLB20]
MIDVIITSYKEPKTIRNTVRSILDRDFSGYRGVINLIVAAPDRATLSAASAEAKRWKHKELILVQDKHRGKPAALNLAMQHLKAPVTVFTDGDVSFSKGTVASLIAELDAHPKLGAVGGRQYSINSRKDFFGYTSHLFTEALHRQRYAQMNGNPENRFFPLSGYVMAVRTHLLKPLPGHILVDDAYLSYEVLKQAYRIGYTPEAAAYVGYPKNLADYFRQKVRSTGGYLQLKNMGIVPEGAPARTLGQDLRMALFPLSFARTPRELVYSLLQYPLRIALWLRIYYLKLIRPDDFAASWQRVESTK